ncbi:MAG: precorrin-3B C(17)-methyltransferase [Oscillospiraceae bacterium]|nr:precorrin-3B C(17)-methyltransferase [Oscillospiraceae bacterium]
MKLYIVGLGPGGGKDLTLRARDALAESNLLVGYSTYIELVKGDFPEKPTLSTPMRREEERCRMALQAAATQTVAMVCSGDPGVYGMASLCYELAGEYPPVEIEVIPGVTAATGGSAVLGAPLGHDFAVISLSDLMTPMEVIETRLDCAARGDFVLCLYNPASRRRKDHLRRACDIVLRHRSPETPCGYVQNIGREGERTVLLSLSQLREAEVDMFTTIYIGSSQTKVIGGKLVTPRGYLQR